MKKMIFVMTILVGGLNQCTRSEPISGTGPDGTLVKSTKDDQSLKDSVKGTVPSDTINVNPMHAKPDDSTAFVFIRMFYKEYLPAFENNDTDSVKRKYCTPALIEKLAKKKLDYDPFLNAQDFDANFLKTLEIGKSNAPQGYYVVSYVDGYSKKKVYIAMSLLEQGGRYMINDIILTLSTK